MITSLVATLQTARDRDAGTDDRVWLDVGGATLELVRAAGNAFEPGQADTFALPSPGLERSDVWRVLVCKNPDRDRAGWTLAGLTLADQDGHVLYSRSGLGASLAEGTGRQWLAPDFVGPAAPPTALVPAEILRALLEPLLAEQLAVDIGPVKHVRVHGPLSLSCECDGVHLAQSVRGRVAASDIDLRLAVTLCPFVLPAGAGAGAAVEIAVGALRVDLQIPWYVHLLTGGVSAAVEYAVEQQLQERLRKEIAARIKDHLGVLAIDLQKLDRIALRPGALELIMNRPDHPPLRRPFPLGLS